MFGKKRTAEEVEAYMASLIFQGEKVEASHLSRLDPLEFAIVTSHRFIGTAVAQSMAPIIRSVPFDRIATVSVTDDDKEPQLGNGSVHFLVVQPHGVDFSLSISGYQGQGPGVFAVYQALMQKVCGVGAPAAAAV